jgi:hypothetical protein
VLEVADAWVISTDSALARAKIAPLNGSKQ